MRYDIKKILCNTALALILSMGYADNISAQGIVTLADDQANDEALNADIPDEISLFDNTDMDDNGSNGLLAPGKVIPKTGIAPANQEAGVIPIIPKTGIVPKTGVAPIVPKTGKAPNDDALPNLEVNGDNPLFMKVPAGSKQPMLAPKGGNIGVLGNESSGIDDKVFSQMSDLEKQTALLSLELRREKVRNEIDAIKNQRRKAIQEESDKREEKERKKLEWEKEQEAKVIKEQQKLKTIELEMDKIRQERYLKAYKNQMLIENQAWVNNNATLYENMKKLRQDKQDMIADFQNKLNVIVQNADAAGLDVDRKKADFAREVSDLQTQIAVLKARVDAQAKELEIEKQNPFAEGSDQQQTLMDATSNEISTPEKPVVILKLSDLYAVMEIRGQGGELVAKLINAEGKPFMVQKGTQLQSGQTIDEITSTYVRTDKGGIKEYLYFAAGGILDREPLKSGINIQGDGELKDEMGKLANESVPQYVTSDSIPGMGSDMMVR